MNEFQLLAVTSILFLCYKWLTRNDNYFRKRSVRHLKPYFFFGNTGLSYFNFYRIFNYYSYVYNAFPSEKLIGLFDFWKPIICVRDPEIVKLFTIKHFDHFSSRPFFFDTSLDRIFGNSLVMLRGQKWNDMRVSLGPTFTGFKMKQMFSLVTECADNMSNHFLKQAIDGKTIPSEMKNIFSKYTNDVIASAAFGLKINTFEQTNNKFWQTGINLTKFHTPLKVFRLFCLRSIPFIMRILNIEYLSKSESNFFRTMVTENIKSRELNAIYRPDMINILMHLKNGISDLNDSKSDLITDGSATPDAIHIRKLKIKKEWNEDELVAQCFAFYAAGFDTVSTLISFISYELAINPYIQQKLYEEVITTNNMLNGIKIDYNMMQNMTYMDMVVSETLRKWPPFPSTERVCVKEFLYDDGKVNFKIEENTCISIPICAFHHDPIYFPNPSKFDPERFNDVNKKNIVTGTYMPFGIGPRYCIGLRFALMSAKAAIYYLMLHFSFEICEKTQIPMKSERNPFNIIPRKGIHLELKLRK